MTIRPTVIEACWLMAEIACVGAFILGLFLVAQGWMR